MPASSLIVGVDLAPIKPIAKAITFQSDITTDKCRTTIRQHLKTWKADTVLHDGAPNIGIAWVQDAFSQAELALQALRLATDFLAEGGTFVTKVFRSKDYNALLWVCNQLFTKVEATKPPSSRNVSAEIFVVCRGFKAPKRIDPRLLDPRSVFAELSDPIPNEEAKIFNPEKKKRKREGYEEGDYTLFKELPAHEFIQTTDPIAMLGRANQLSFVQPPNGDIALAALKNLPETTQEIRDCCSDLKVLGRKDFRSLLRWRLRAREIFGFGSKRGAINGNTDEEVAKVEPMDEDLRIQQELQMVNVKETSRKKRERRRENERKHKEIVRMQMHMMPPTEIGLEQAGPHGENSMFALASLDKSSTIEKLVRVKMALPLDRQEQESSVDSFVDVEISSEGDFLDRELDDLYLQYQERRSRSDAKYLTKKAKKEHQNGDWEGFSDYEDSSRRRFSEDSGSESVSKDGTPEKDAQSWSKPNITTVDTNGGLTRKAALFFEKDVFKDIGKLIEQTNKDNVTHMESDGLATNSIIGGGIDSGQTKAKMVFMTRRSNPTVHPKLSSTELPFSSPKQSEAEDMGGGRLDLGVERNTDDFEIVQSSLACDWDRQSDLRQDGRLGNRRPPLVSVD